MRVASAKPLVALLAASLVVPSACTAEETDASTGSGQVSSTSGANRAASGGDGRSVSSGPSGGDGGSASSVGGNSDSSSASGAGNASGGAAGSSGGASSAGGNSSTSASSSGAGGGIIDSLTLDPLGCAPMIDGSIDLGHGSDVTALAQAGDRAVSLDLVGHWNLWDETNRREVLAGDIGENCYDDETTYIHCPVGPDHLCCEPFNVRLHGSTLMVQAPDGIEIRGADDGQIRFVAAPAEHDHHAGLSDDGSYFWSNGTSGITIRSTSDGALRFVLAGDFWGSTIQGFAGALYVAGAGQDLETLDPLDGSVVSTVSTDSAVFFTDGQAFVSDDASGTIVHWLDGTETTLPASDLKVFGGYDHYVWGEDSTAHWKVFDLDDLSAPKLSFTAGSTVIGAGDKIASLSSDEAAENQFQLVQLGPDAVTLDVPAPGVAKFEHFACDANGSWSVSSGSVVYDGASYGPIAPRPLNCGKMMVSAGSSAGVAAVAVESGAVLLLDLQPNTPGLLGAFNRSTGALALSDDGRELFLAHNLSWPYLSDSRDQSLLVVNRRDGTVDHDFVFRAAPNFNRLFQFAASRDGAFVSMVFEDSIGELWQTVTEVSSGSEVFREQITAAVTSALSPSGAAWAVAVNNNPPQTEIHQRGNLTATVAGYPVAWLDEDRVLIEYAVPDQLAIYSTQGAELGLVPRGVDTDAVPINPETVYSDGSEFDLTTGATLWSAPVLGPGGTVAGSYVVYASNASLKTILH